MAWYDAGQILDLLTRTTIPIVVDGEIKPILETIARRGYWVQSRVLLKYASPTDSASCHWSTAIASYSGPKALRPYYRSSSSSNCCIHAGNDGLIHRNNRLGAAVVIGPLALSARGSIPTGPPLERNNPPFRGTTHLSQYLSRMQSAGQFTGALSRLVSVKDKPRLPQLFYREKRVTRIIPNDHASYDQWSGNGRFEGNVKSFDCQFIYSSLRIREIVESGATDNIDGVLKTVADVSDHWKDNTKTLAENRRGQCRRSCTVSHLHDSSDERASCLQQGAPRGLHLYSTEQDRYRVS